MSVEQVGGKKAEKAEKAEKVLDGGILEGGGQIIRNATALAVLLGIPLRLQNIRAGRPNPGLQRQHSTGALLVCRDMSPGSTVQGAELGSTELSFVPGKLTAGRFTANIKSAGSVGLLIQNALPCAIFAPGPCDFVLQGGTDTQYAPPMDYLRHVTRPILARMGIDFDMTVLRRGFFPKGCGTVTMRTLPILSHIQPLILETRGTVARLWGRVFVSGFPREVAEVMVATATKVLRQTFPATAVPSLVIGIEEEDPVPVPVSSNSAFGLLLVAETDTGCLFGGSAVESGARGGCLSPEVVAQSAGDMLLADLLAGGCVDQHLQDQLIIFMALARGRSRVRLGSMELHTRTAMHFAQELAAGATFRVIEDKKDSTFLVECDGIGFSSSQK